MRERQSQHGFTLSEVLVASAIFMLVVLAALTLYDRGNRSFKEGVESGNMQQNSRVAFEKMLGDLRMTGFDYDRDGIPSVGTQRQQPDEQVEFLGSSAVTIRGNFNYDSQAAPCSADPTSPVQCDNGRERDYEPTTGQYPVVTTGNNEIVTYGLMSKNGPNNDSITFYADVAKPRNSFTNPESLVTINDVDLTNANPPYTLFRFTINDAGTVVRTAIAENVRSLRFQYFEDTAGTIPLRTLANPPVAIPEANLATTVGGAGQFTPANPSAIVPQRNIRRKVNSIRVTLVGMNESQDMSGFRDAADTIAPKYRKFTLSSLVVPRNTGRRGVLEQESRPPGPPTITAICYGYCGVAWVRWNAPVAGATTGAPEQYAIWYDTVPGGNQHIEYVSNVNEFFIYIDGDPAQRYFFTVQAINSYGAAISTSVPTSAPGIDVRNASRPAAPQTLTASGGGSIAAVANKIDLTWNFPTGNASGGPSCTSGPAPGALPAAEVQGWRIFRKKDTDAAWPATPIVDETASGPTKPVLNTYTNTVSWSDTTVSNCINYEYKVQTIERCQLPAQNNGGATGISVDSPVITGRAESAIQPAAPATLAATGTCPDPITNASADCNVTLTWPAVMTDITPTPVSIGKYVIKGTRKLVGNASYSATLADIPVYPAVLSGMISHTFTVRYNDPVSPVAAGVYYFEFAVVAQQCSAPDSAASPIVRFPCTFAGGTITVSVNPSPADGAGTSASPWFIDSPAAITLSTTAPVVSMSATFTPASGAPVSLGNLTGSPTMTSGSFNIPSLSIGDTGMVTITVRDSGGCQAMRSYYVSEAASGCCLIPYDIEPAIAFVDPSSKSVRFRLKNFCSSPLEIRSVTLNWNRTYTNGNPNVSAYFPSALNQAIPSVQAVPNPSSTSSPVTFPRPGSGTVMNAPMDTAAASDDYYMRFVWSRSPFPSALSGIVTSMTVQYRRPSDLSDVQCQIAPTQ